jgi:hypothetical protein
LRALTVARRFTAGGVRSARPPNASNLAATARDDTRAVGAIFLAIAVLTLFAIFSTRRLLAGLLLVTAVIGFVTAARVLGLVVDGATPETVFKPTPEVALLIVTGLGIWVEIRRQSQVKRASPVAGAVRPQSRRAEARPEANPAFIVNR